VINLAGLQGILICANELSVFQVRPDIWIVQQVLGSMMHAIIYNPPYVTY